MTRRGRWSAPEPGRPFSAVEIVSEKDPGTIAASPSGTVFPRTVSSWWATRFGRTSCLEVGGTRSTYRTAYLEP